MLLILETDHVERFSPEVIEDREYVIHLNVIVASAEVYVSVRTNVEWWGLVPYNA